MPLIPQLFGGYLVCAQAVLFFDTQVSKKCANHTFGVWRTVWVVSKGFEGRLVPPFLADFYQISKKKESSIQTVPENLGIV
jgi:hypothetical protein